MVGWATGGGRKNAGRSMAETHKDLKITADEWTAFLDDFHQTMQTFDVPTAEEAELTAIINRRAPTSSFRLQVPRLRISFMKTFR